MFDSITEMKQRAIKMRHITNNFPYEKILHFKSDDILYICKIAYIQYATKVVYAAAVNPKIGINKAFNTIFNKAAIIVINAIL